MSANTNTLRCTVVTSEYVCTDKVAHGQCWVSTPGLRGGGFFITVPLEAGAICAECYADGHDAA